MAWLFGDSFDHYATADITKKWNVKTGLPVIASGGRNGSNGLSFSGNSTNYYLTKVLDTPAPSSPTVVIGVAWKVTSVGVNGLTLCQVVDAGTQQFSLCINTDLTLTVKRGAYNGTALGTTVRALNSGVWAYVELKVLIDAASGAVELRVNGEAWAPFPLSSQNTRGSSTTAYNALYLGNQSSINYLVAIVDDLYVLDGTDSGIANNPLNDFLGDTRGEALLPNGNGATSGFTGSDSNQIDNYLLVDEATPNDDTDYVAAQTAATKDTYAFADAQTVGSIRHVQHLLAMKKTDTATKTVVSVVRDGGGTDRDSAATQNPAQTTYDYYRYNYSKDPSTDAAWIKDNLNACEFGQKITV